MRRSNNENTLPKIRVIIRDDKPKNKEGKHPIEYIVRLRGKRKRKSSGLHVKSKYWNKKKQRAVSKFFEHDRINKVLDNKIADFDNYFLKMSALGQNINMCVVDEYFKDKRFDDFFGYFDVFNNNWEAQPRCLSFNFDLKNIFNVNGDGSFEKNMDRQIDKFIGKVNDQLRDALIQNT